MSDDKKLTLQEMVSLFADEEVNNSAALIAELELAGAPQAMLDEMRRAQLSAVSMYLIAQCIAGADDLLEAFFIALDRDEVSVPDGMMPLVTELNSDAAFAAFTMGRIQQEITRRSDEMLATPLGQNFQTIINHIGKAPSPDDV